MHSLQSGCSITCHFSVVEAAWADRMLRIRREEWRELRLFIVGDADFRFALGEVEEALASAEVWSPDCCEAGRFPAATDDIRPPALGDEPDACRWFGAGAFGILFTTDPGRRTNDSPPEGLAALIPSRLELFGCPFLALGVLGLVVDEEDVRRLPGNGEPGEAAGRSRIESSRRERRLAASHAAFAIGDALSFASRWAGVS